MSIFGRTRVVGMVMDECQGAPTPSVGTVTVAHGTCSGSAIQWTIPWTGMTFGAFELEVWRAAWIDSDSEPSPTFFSRRTSGSSMVETETDAGSDGGGAARTYHRRYEVRAVPAGSANGAGPFCHISALSSDVSQASNLCVA